MKVNDQSQICRTHKEQALFYNDNDIEIREKYPCLSCCKKYLLSNQNQNGSESKEKYTQIINHNLKFLTVFEKSLSFYEQNLIHLIQEIKSQIFATTQSLMEQEKILMRDKLISKKKKEFIKQCVSEMKQNIWIELSKASQLSKVENLEAIFKLGITNIDNIKPPKINNIKPPKTDNIKPSKTNSIKNLSRQDSVKKLSKSDSIKNLSKTDNIKPSKTEQQSNSFTPSVKIQVSSQINHDSICNAMAFNKSSTELAAGYSNLILVYQLTFQGEFTLSQTLKCHKKNISCLQYMKNEKSLISGGQDGLIVIWEYDEQNYWNQTYIINEHNYSVTCIKINCFQDILASSGVDCTIRFFYKYNSPSWIVLNQIDTSSYVTDLSFNKSSKQLYCCEINQRILILETIPFSLEWRVKQKIKTTFNGIQICSIGLTSFVILDFKSLTFGTYQQEQNEFIKCSELELIKESQKIQSFHMRNIVYNNQRKLLFVQLGETLQLISCSEAHRSKLQIEFLMKLQEIPHYGRMSEDRKYFAYWESSTNFLKILEIQLN